MQMQYALSTETDCDDARRNDLIAINSILNTPGALSILWLIIKEHQATETQWVALFKKEGSDD